MGQLFRFSAIGGDAADIVLGGKLAAARKVDPLVVERPGREVIVIAIRVDPDPARVPAAAVHDHHGIAGIEREIDEPLSVMRPRRVHGVFLEKRAGRTAEEWHEPETNAGGASEPDFKSVA